MFIQHEVPPPAVSSLTEEQEGSPSTIEPTPATPIMRTTAPIPDRYRFETGDGVVVDIRKLFLYGFIHPVTKERLTAQDLARLRQHQDLGFSVFRFSEMGDLFELTLEDGTKIDIAHPAWIEQFSPKQLETRQKCYAHYSGLAELFDHLTPAFLDEQSAGPNADIVEPFKDFAILLKNTRSSTLWHEMDNPQFFDKAAIVIKEMKRRTEAAKKTIWDISTDDFFQAMRDFALSSEAIMAQSGESGYIRSLSGREYVVRVDSTKGIEQGKAILRNLVLQYKRSFDIAYHYEKLPVLMDAMTPNGTCVAEKMRAMASVFNNLSSLGPERMKLGNLHTMMGQAILETPKSAVWVQFGYSEQNNLDYVVAKYVGKHFVNDRGESFQLDSEIARYYMINFLGYDQIGAAPELTPKQKRALSIFDGPADAKLEEDSEDEDAEAKAVPVASVVGAAEETEDEEDEEINGAAQHKPGISAGNPFYFPHAGGLFPPHPVPMIKYRDCCETPSIMNNFFIGAAGGAYLALFDSYVTLSLVLYSGLVCGLAAVLIIPIAANLLNCCFSPIQVISYQSLEP